MPDTPNSLELSDEDFMNQPEPEEPEIVESEEVEEKPEVEEPEIKPEVETEDEATDDEEEPSNEKDDPTEASEESEQEGDTEEVKAEADAPAEIDYKAEYAKILTPFRANHKDVQVNSVDDALNLMKMGANYTQKMQSLKPNLKLMKMLANNDLLSEDKLSYLIDLNKKDPNAVSKLIKDSGIDPLDIDTETKTDYKPNTYTVNDTEVELDAVLDDIRGTSAFEDTIDIISNKLDEPSKQVLLKNPSIIQTLNSQVENGIYAQVMGIVDNERMMGRLTGLSDLAAYKQVGDIIQSNGGFNKSTPPVDNSVAQPPDTKDINSKDEQRRISKKKAASSTKSTKASNKKADFNPLSMSDEEFEKATAGTFI